MRQIDDPKDPQTVAQSRGRPARYMRLIYIIGASVLWMLSWGMMVAPALSRPPLSFWEAFGCMMLVVAARLAWEAGAP